MSTIKEQNLPLTELLSAADTTAKPEFSRPQTILEKDLTLIPGIPAYKIELRHSMYQPPSLSLLLNHTLHPFVENLPPWEIRAKYARRLSMSLFLDSDQNAISELEELQVWYHCDNQFEQYYCFTYNQQPGNFGVAKLKRVSKIQEDHLTFPTDSKNSLQEFNWNQSPLTDKLAVATTELNFAVPTTLNWSELLQTYITGAIDGSLTSQNVHNNPLNPRGMQ